AVELPKAPEGAEWTKAPRIVSKLHYRQDRVGFQESGFVHLFVVPAHGGTPRELTSGEWNVGARFDGLGFGAGFDWTPNGRAIVFEGLRDTSGDAHYRSSRIYAVDVASGSIRAVADRPGFWYDPAVSPDGRRVAFVGHDSTGDTYALERLHVIDMDGSGWRTLTAGYDREPTDPLWAANNSGVYFTAQDQGSVNVHFASTGGDVRAITEGAQVLSLGSASRNGVAVGIRSDPDEPGDVVRYSLRGRGRPVRLTDVNADLLAGKRLAPMEEVWYESTGGARVQGWIVKPPDFGAAKTYPLVLEIHGGPFAMYNAGFNLFFQLFAANGYVVLYTNPRGSTGYGEAFSKAIDFRYPGVDYDDLIAGVDAVLAKGYVDASRMYVGGCSGGGVLSSWVIGHTDRFAAAAVRCPVVNWISMAGTTDIPNFTHSFFHQPFWQDPSRWLEQSSLMYVGNVKTPTIVMTGELDIRTPMPQSEEYYVALKMAGVETKLLRFHEEYHGTSSKPSNFMRTVLYMMDWYGQHGGAKAAAVPAEAERASSNP
ncbi:MAG: S9 family peptidase, partial [Gemmatimonadota bacterium]